MHQNGKFMLGIFAKLAMHSMYFGNDMNLYARHILLFDHHDFVLSGEMRTLLAMGYLLHIWQQFPQGERSQEI